MEKKNLTEEIRALKYQLKKKDKKLNSIQQMSRALGSTLNIDRLLMLIMKEITSLMDADRSTLYIVDHERSELWAKIALKAEIEEIRQKIGKGMSGYVAATGEVVNIPDVYQDARFDPSTDRRTGYKSRSMLCMPVFEPHAPRSEKRIIAVIQVLNKKSGVFTEEDEELLAALAGQVAIAIANARLYDRVKHRLVEIDLLHSFEQLLNGENKLSVIFQKMLIQTVKHMQAQWGFILVPDQHSMIAAAADADGNQFYNVAALSHWTDAMALLKSPSPEQLQAQWPVLKRFLKIPGDPDFNRSPVMFVDIEMPNHQRGLVMISGAMLGKAQRFHDEQKILAIIAQKFSRALELRQLREGLLKQERLSAIGQMMSTVAHDIRSPVSTIYGFVDLMQDDSTTAKERSSYADVIRSEIQATINLITEVLDFAKGKTSILPRKVSAPSLVTRFRQRLEQMCELNQTELAIDVQTRQLIHVDVDKMDRVFYNVTKNALEAMGSGGKLTFSVFEENDQIVFRFTDTGPGIPEDIQGRLFDSFVTSGKKSGTGLGLAIVKKIIDEHHGQIIIDSRSGTGVTLFIKLPVYSKKQTKQPLTTSDV